MDQLLQQYESLTCSLEKNIFLNHLHDTDENTFYKLVKNNIEKMLPIVYTPTVGQAIQQLSLPLQRPRSLCLSFNDLNTIDEKLPDDEDIRLIVVTDGTGILGIGDQGAEGVHIAIAKLMVYTLCCGIHPKHTLAIQLDLGTDNKSLLSNDKYCGWHHPRVSSDDYNTFIKRFVAAIKSKFPRAFLHWEDFSQDNARKILEDYRNQLCTFNDDIQGTGAVAVAALMSAIQQTGTTIKDQRIVIFGAGSSGLGIAEQLHDSMQRMGMTADEAYDKFYLLNSRGLITKDTPNIRPAQKPYAKNWQFSGNKITLEDVVTKIAPTILIGCSTVANAFTEEIIKTMAKKVDQPIIMPLSNPNSKAEAHPKNILEWTKGKALIATGSPFDNVTYQQKTIPITQCNNAWVFPSIGLGVMISQARLLTDNMLWAATKELFHASITEQKILPTFSDITPISHKIAIAVAQQAQKDGVATTPNNVDFNIEIKKVYYDAS